MPNVRQELDWKPVDLSQFKVEGKKSKLDANEDAWEFAAPPDPGRYKLKLFLQKDGLKAANYDPKDPEAVWFQAAMECRIVSDDEEVNNIPVFAYVSTRIGRGKNISTMAGLLVKAGYKIPEEATDRYIARMLEAALKKEPIVEAELDWRGAYRVEKGGSTSYVNVCNTYKDFPLDSEKKDGSRLHIFTKDTKEDGTQEIRAQINLVRWFGKDDKPKLVSQPKFAQPTKIRTEEPQMQLESKPSQQVNGRDTNKLTEDQELELLLQEN